MPPYETFNAAAFVTMKELISFMRNRKAALGDRARTLTWPLGWSKQNAGVYQVVTLSCAPGWGIKNRFSSQLAIFPSTEASKIDPASATIETNFSDNRACLKVPHTAISKVIVAMKFTEKLASFIVAPEIPLSRDSVQEVSCVAPSGVGEAHACAQPVGEGPMAQGIAVASAVKEEHIADDSRCLPPARTPVVEPPPLAANGFDETSFQPPDIPTRSNEDAASGDGEGEEEEEEGEESAEGEPRVT